jgi:hypothetical protein
VRAAILAIANAPFRSLTIQVWYFLPVTRQREPADRRLAIMIPPSRSRSRRYGPGDGHHRDLGHARTVVVTDDTLFAATGSAVVLETETVLSIRPTDVGVTTIFTLTVDA